MKRLFKNLYIVTLPLLINANMMLTTFPNDKNIRTELLKIIEKGDINKVYHNKHPFSTNDHYTYKTIRKEIYKLQKQICNNKKFREVIDNKHKVNLIYSNYIKVNVVSIDNCELFYSKK